MFRRSSSSATPSAAAGSESTPEGDDDQPRKGYTPKKGRPTPTRAVAVEASKLRAKPPRTRKEQAAARRKASSEGRPVLARDQGPVRHFIRDFVDVRFSFLEILMPAMVIVLVTQLFAGSNQTVASVTTLVMLFALMLAIVDAVFLRLKLGKELKARFPEGAGRGNTWYAISRAMQMRFMRLPKPQKKIGGELAATYR